MSTVWDWIQSLFGWFFQYHVIFRTAALVLLIAAVYCAFWALSTSTWQPLALFAVFSTLATFAVVLTHPESLNEH